MPFHFLFTIHAVHAAKSIVLHLDNGVAQSLFCLADASVVLLRDMWETSAVALCDTRGHVRTLHHSGCRRHKLLLCDSVGYKPSLSCTASKHLI